MEGGNGEEKGNVRCSKSLQFCCGIDSLHPGHRLCVATVRGALL